MRRRLKSSSAIKTPLSSMKFVCRPCCLLALPLPSFIHLGGKEYSKGDSRYVARDPATVTVEAITAVLEGPALLLSVYGFSHLLTKGFTACSYAIARQKSDSHILQFTVCLGQLYGCLVYLPTWVASTSGLVRSTSGLISLDPTVCGL
uniref:EXPERA domain-containing protein n=1 Tax=Oryza barthii TaxID=65489 RepID=A0A0D3GHA0_9ORYZ